MSAQKKLMTISVIKKSMDLSLYWAERSKKPLEKIHIKHLFGIVQGGLI